MPAINFLDYSRAIENTLPKAEHKHTPSGIEIGQAPPLAQIINDILNTFR